MAKTFECPKCGAPLTYNAVEQNYKESISCPYCNETVIVPEEMRVKPEIAPRFSTPVENDLGGMSSMTQTTFSTGAEMVTEARTAVGRTIKGCVIAGVVGVAIFIVIILFAFNSIKNSIVDALGGNGAVAAIVNPQPTDVPPKAIRPMIDAITETVGAAINTVLTSIPAKTPTPEIDQTATVAAKATLQAQNGSVEVQRNWPVVVQEKFTNDARNWNIGTDNNSFALEELSIAGGKYTWKYTSKKSMGSFSYPDMPDQTDMFVSVDMQVTASGPNSADQFGIIFRDNQKENTFYFFSVNPLGTYSLSMYDGNEWADLIPVTDTNLLKPGQVNHIAVSMEGTQIIVVINNQVVNGFEDTRLSVGGAGLGIYLAAPGEDATVIYTNFVVRAPKK